LLNKTKLKLVSFHLRITYVYSLVEEYVTGFAVNPKICSIFWSVNCQIISYNGIFVDVSSCNFKDLFTIDPYSGDITTLMTLNREIKDVYEVIITATDNSPSALFKTGEHNKIKQTFLIEIARY